MTVITTLEAQGRIKETNPFPSGEGGDFSLLEIQHKHLILHPNKIQTALHRSVRTGIRLVYDGNGEVHPHPILQAGNQLSSKCQRH